MNYLKSKGFISYVLLISMLCLQSCQQGSGINKALEEHEIPSSQKNKVAGFQVSKKQAVQVAESFANSYNLQPKMLLAGRLVQSNGKPKNVNHVLELKNKNHQVFVYLINYSQGGFAIVPADQRINPILAYSNHNKIPETKNDTIPEGFEIWLNGKMEEISEIRTNNTNQKATTLQQARKETANTLWDRLLGNTKSSKNKGDNR